VIVSDFDQVDRRRPALAGLLHSPNSMSSTVNMEMRAKSRKFSVRRMR
jgi:hypothetical protein